MLPAFLITFREVIEATLIVATILGILFRLKQKKAVKSVWLATIAAATCCTILIVAGSLTGIKVQEFYSGKTETFIEGVLTSLSALFITWAVFFLHKYFGRHKAHLLQKIKTSVENQEEKGIFWLTFTAVFREGIEIVLFLTTIYFSSDPQRIIGGFLGGIIAALIISSGLFSATVKLPIYYTFRITSALLILFAAGLLARGISEFVELGILPEIGRMTFVFIPVSTTFAGDMIRAVFGITRNMDLIQLTIYGVYIILMGWKVFIRKTPK